MNHKTFNKSPYLLLIILCSGFSLPSFAGNSDNESTTSNDSSHDQQTEWGNPSVPQWKRKVDKQSFTKSQEEMNNRRETHEQNQKDKKNRLEDEKKRLEAAFDKVTLPDGTKEIVLKAQYERHLKALEEKYNPQKPSLKKEAPRHKMKSLDTVLRQQKLFQRNKGLAIQHKRQLSDHGNAHRDMSWNSRDWNKHEFKQDQNDINNTIDQYNQKKEKNQQRQKAQNYIEFLQKGQKNSFLSGIFSDKTPPQK